MSVSSVIRQGLGSTTSDLVRLGLGSGAPPPAAIGPIITLGLKYTPSDVIRLGLGASVATTPTITSVTAVSGTELSVAWTGTATQYRLNGGTATALPDGTSPDTISGLTPNTEYTVELRDGAGAWSDPVSEWTDNTGGGGGELDSTAEMAATGGSGAFSGSVSSPAVVALDATGGGGTFSGAAGFEGASMDATGDSGTFSGSAYIAGTVAMDATGGSGTFAGSAVGASASTGAGIKKRKQAGMKAAPLPMMAPPQQMDMAEVSMILAALFEVGVFNGVAD